MNSTVPPTTVTDGFALTQSFENVLDTSATPTLSRCRSAPLHATRPVLVNVLYGLALRCP
jgi:hypothetical protein